MSLFYLDKGGLTAFWGKVKGLFSKTKPVFINFYSDTKRWYETYQNSADWSFDSISTFDGETITNEQLWQRISNGAQVYLKMTSNNVSSHNYTEVTTFQEFGRESKFVELSGSRIQLYFKNSILPSVPTVQQPDVTIIVYISTASPWGDPDINTITNATIESVYIPYDNSISGLTSSNVQGAIDAVAYDVSNLTGNDIEYYNSASGLTATDVQDAIDEVSSNLNSLEADDIPYSNSYSQLSSTDVQSAIDEVNNAIPSDADDISYDNTTSGLTATNVKDAIDEVAAGGGGGSSTLSGLSDVSISGLTSGQFLTYGGASWSNDTVEIDDLDDVDIVSPSSGQILEYDGTDWVNSDTLKNINSGIDNEGERSASITSGASNWENLREVTLTKGVWLLIGFVNYPKMTTQPTSDNSGYCGALISNTSNASSANYYGTVIVGRARDEVTRIQVVTIRNVTKSSEKYYLEAKHYNVAGTASSARGELWHIRLR